MKSFAAAAWACLAVVCVACGSKSRLLPDLPCFDAEKLRATPLMFGDLSPDASAPGGWSGVEVHFGVDAAGALTARVRETGGASRQTRAVQRVTYDANEDSLSLAYAGPADTRFLRAYRPACNRLVGFMVYFRTPEDSVGIVVEDTLPHVERR